eukprot:m.214673 g.214673  ORF g.214673 m.214673 type:complete len:74 (+) comp25591_c0_seq1:4502-4723(+)
MLDPRPDSGDAMGYCGRWTPLSRVDPVEDWLDDAESGCTIDGLSCDSCCVELSEGLPPLFLTASIALRRVQVA